MPRELAWQPLRPLTVAAEEACDVSSHAFPPQRRTIGHQL